MRSILDSLKRLLSNQQLSVMLLFIVALLLIIVFFGKMIAPLLAAIVIAYLLQGLIKRLGQRIPKFLAINLVFWGFGFFVLSVMIIALPLLLNQAKDFLTSLPDYVNLGRDWIMMLPEKYPDTISEERANSILNTVNTEFTTFVQNILSGGVIAPLVGMLSLAIYLILVPVMVFFLLKDKDSIIDWLGEYLPFKNHLLREIWIDIDMQIGNYIRGKFIEIILIWAICFIDFKLLNLNYAMLLSFMVGVSVLIPYIGATVVTLPVVIVALVQFGLTTTTGLIVGSYLVIQILDGNVLVPLIFSEAVKIHPVAIIVAILVFGGLWGFWGVFFAIPFATVVKAILHACSKALEQDKITS